MCIRDSYSAPTSGFNLQLTIDGDIQDIVERELNNAYAVSYTHLDVYKRQVF